MRIHKGLWFFQLFFFSIFKFHSNSFAFFSEREGGKLEKLYISMVLSSNGIIRNLGSQEFYTRVVYFNLIEELLKNFKFLFERLKF